MLDHEYLVFPGHGLWPKATCNVHLSVLNLNMLHVKEIFYMKGYSDPFFSKP